LNSYTGGKERSPEVYKNIDNTDMLVITNTLYDSHLIGGPGSPGEGTPTPPTQKTAIVYIFSSAEDHLVLLTLVVACLCGGAQRELIRRNREQKRSAPTLVLPNEDVPAGNRPRPRDESKPLMRGAGQNVTRVVSPYSQYCTNRTLLLL